MQSATHSVTVADPECWIWWCTEARQSPTVLVLEIHHDFDAERRKSYNIERPAPREISDGEIDMMNHGCDLTYSARISDALPQ